ncbi:phosphotransferase [Pleomorphovibrio marinus]|uniref:phosphotransferase n=1 Tax=Pleomorphovibrio marinus TaxID=2164132 RepID=UPI000E0B642F|nr:phosphotransferase [Pleomorphovibrio marinus]
MVDITLPLDQKQESFLRKELKCLHPEEKILRYEKAGEGNMNQVIRLKTDRQSLILKQSRPYVNKYPQVPAPLERISVEKAFYEKISSNEILGAYTVSHVDYLPTHYLLVLEDLGEARDFSSIYSDPSVLQSDTLSSLVSFLKNLHGLSEVVFPDNYSMKLLNHEHIFIFPYREDNDFDLNQIQEGLGELAEPFKKDQKLVNKIALVGQRYLKQGKALLHGDFYPGSWLDKQGNVRVIDMEFAFKGDPEFDLGVMLAHLKMARYPEEILEREIYRYGTCDTSLLLAFCGVEILRRLFGLAQLPLHLELKEKEKIAKEAAQYVLEL